MTWGPTILQPIPELLDYLAKQLEAKSFNLKDMISWIVLSEPYALVEPDEFDKR